MLKVILNYEQTMAEHNIPLRRVHVLSAGGSLYVKEDHILFMSLIMLKQSF